MIRNQLCSLVSPPGEQLAVRVDGGLDVDSRVDGGDRDVGAELVAAEEGVWDLHRSPTELERRTFAQDAEPPHEHVALI